LGDNAAVVASSIRCGCLGLLAVLSSTAHACDSGAVALFGCDAASSRKFIELCAPAPLNAQSGYLLYRFGALDKDGVEKAVELEYPAERRGSLKRFYAATYEHGGVYTQSVRFVTGTLATPCTPERAARKPSMPVSKCATARAARRRSSRAARGPASTSSSSRDSSPAIQKRPLAPRA